MDIVFLYRVNPSCPFKNQNKEISCKNTKKEPFFMRPLSYVLVTLKSEHSQIKGIKSYEFFQLSSSGITLDTK